MQTIIRIAETISFLKISDIDPKTDIVAGDVNIVSFSRAIERFEPAICRFIENKAVIVIIPESRSRTFKRTWINPVTNPARAPTRKDIKRARYGFTPFTSKTAVTAAPKGKLPSTVRSGKSNILYVIYTPKERRAYIKP